MARANNVSNSNNLTPVWIALGVLLAAIILFAIFFPRRSYNTSLQQGQMMQPYPMMQMEHMNNMEDADAEALMENMSNDDDPASIMNSDRPMLIFFHAPWCGHCQRAKPEFQKLMQRARGRAHMIDCDAHKEIAQQHDIQGFPTIRYYPNGPKNGNPQEYMGDRTADSMLQFMSQ
jgi:thiol-disulfide isomerase/thioredoxin